MLEKKLKKLRGGLIAKDIDELARDDGPDSALAQTDANLNLVKASFVLDIERESNDLGPLNRLNAGQWHEFFEDIFSEYPQLDVILCRPTFLSVNFQGRKVTWGVTFTNNDAYLIVNHFSKLLVLQLTGRVDLPKNTLTVWKILERIHELKQQFSEPDFQGYVRTTFGAMKSINDDTVTNQILKIEQLFALTFDRDFSAFTERIDTFRLKLLFMMTENSQTTHFLIEALSAIYENSKDDKSSEVVTILDIGRKMDQNPEYLSAVNYWQAKHIKSSYSETRAQYINLLLNDQVDGTNPLSGHKKNKKKGIRRGNGVK